jgi:hypothetical protein
MGPTGSFAGRLTYTGGTGYTGPNTTTNITYFLDDFNLKPTPPVNRNSIYIINGSFQAFVNGNNSGGSTNLNLRNLSASIFRDIQDMSGTTLSPTAVNLANGQINSDVAYPPTNPSPNPGYYLNSSLWTFSSTNNSTAINGITIYMQAIDTSFNAGTQYYYAIRINTDSPYLYNGNIRLSTINFN